MKVILIPPYAKRYALALFRLADEQKIITQIYKELKFVSSEIKRAKDLQIIIRHPFIKNRTKSAIFSQLFESYISKLLLSWLRLVIVRGRAYHFEGVERAFEELYFDYIGLEKVNLVSAYLLTKNEIQICQNALEKQLNKKVCLTINVDKQLIGGVKLFIKDMVIDGSLKNRLNNLSSTWKQLN